ncbi:MAG: PQQ-binding-like beta-propeller repeat protein [Bacteroidota bacterium]
MALLLAGCSSIRLGVPLGASEAGTPSGPLERAWERDAQGAFGPSAAQITEAFVVVGTRRGEVVVIDRADGRVAGVGEFGESVEGAVALSADGVVIYVPRAERRGGVTAYDVRNGRQQWRWDGGATSAGVVRLGDVVVAATLDGRAVGLDAASGEALWETRPDSTAQFHAAPVAVGPEAVLFADDRGRVTLREAATGDVRWTQSIRTPVYERPAVDDAQVYVATTRGLLVALDRETGQIRWTRDARAEEKPRLSAPAVADGAVAVGGTDGVVVVYDAQTAEERWRTRFDANVSAAPLWMGDRLMVGTFDGRIVALDAATGAEVWEDDLRGRVKSALVAADDLLIVLTEPRHVVAYRPARLAAR